MSFISRTIFVLMILTSGIAAAQVQDSIINADEIISVFKFKKKGVLPFGFKPGTSIQQVKTDMGTTEIFKEDSSYITYTVYFSRDKYDFGDITFEFSDSLLTDASMETYFGKKEPATKTLNLIKLHFDKIYKGGTYADKTLQWNYSKKGVGLLIEMTEVEFEDDNGFVIDFLTSEPGKSQ